MGTQNRKPRADRKRENSEDEQSNGVSRGGLITFWAFVALGLYVYGLLITHTAKVASGG